MRALIAYIKDKMISRFDDNDIKTGSMRYERDTSEDALYIDTPEALAALLDEAREEARASAEAVLAEAKLELQAQRDQLDRLLTQMDGARAVWTAEVRNVLGELVVAGVRSLCGAMESRSSLPETVPVRYPAAT